MPELFGIFDSSGINLTHREGFNRMRSLFLEHPNSNVFTKETPYLLISLLLNNKHDSAYSRLDADQTSTCGWIGNPATSYQNHLLEKFHERSQYEIFPKIYNIRPPFCSVISPPNESELFLISDHFGHQPIYYSHNKNIVIFSTKPSPILKAKLFQWEINPCSVIEFFTYEHVFRNKTFVKTYL